jgi:outer membrane murein-binding lipoprotein Lpp
MQWLKRNLFLVLGGVVALGLLGIAGFYLNAKIQQDQSVTGELDTATHNLETLAKRDPYPNADNISAAKEEAVRLKGFLTELEKHFLPAPYPTNLDNMVFRTYLDTTQSRLLADARRAGVEVPTNYWFTFAAQKGAMNFAPASLPSLASQLADIKTLCEVLFDAKVNSLVWMKRAAVDSQDSSLGSQDYLSEKPVTNSWAVIMPYEVAFQGFSSGLAAVLEGLASLPHCFMVTNIVVEPAATAAAPTEQTPMSDLYSRYFHGGYPADSATLMRQRYGGYRYGPRYGPMPMPEPQVIRPVSRGPVNVLDEKPLRFTLSIQAVKLKTQK